MNDIVTLLENIDDFYRDGAGSVVDNIESEMSTIGLTGETKEALVKIRVNQSVFREKILDRYKKCCLCGVSDPRFLIASHIKPWSASTADEKLDVDNGFLLCPNHDKLFDCGLITFDDDGCIIISNEISQADRVFMNVITDMKINLTEKSKEFIKHHRKVIYKG